MLPDDLSTDLTSLNEHADRLSVVVELTVAADGTVQDGTAYRAVTRNAAQLAYSSVGPWLEGQGAAPPERWPPRRICRRSSVCRTKPRRTCARSGTAWARSIWIAPRPRRCCPMAT